MWMKKKVQPKKIAKRHQENEDRKEIEFVTIWQTHTRSHTTARAYSWDENDSQMSTEGAVFYYRETNFNFIMNGEFRNKCNANSWAIFSRV